MVFSDSNWAGLDGGVMMRGTHHLKSWSRTQKNVTLSSAKAELLAAVKASGEALGMLQLMSSVGVPMASIMVDSSAALAVLARKGNGKLRCQSGTSLGATVRRRRGPDEPNGEENPSDSCTKQVARAGQFQRSGASVSTSRPPSSRGVSLDLV